MNETNEIYRERWWKRILETRRKYFFERLRSEHRSLLKILSWFKDDIIYIFLWTLNTLIQIKRFGGDIKKHHKVSYTSQFIRMMVLATVIRVNPVYFRKYRLFKKETWERAKYFAYAHGDVQREFSEKLFPEEIDLFLNKLKFHEFCKNHEWFNPDIVVVYEKGKQTFLNNSNGQFPKQDLFLKKVSGMMGKGAKKLTYRDGIYTDKEGNGYSLNDLVSLLQTLSANEYPVLLQKVVKNHKSWMGFTSGALATCRIVTYRLPGEQKVEPLFAAFRMPAGIMDVDNFSAGGIATSVNLKNGVLGKGVSSRPIHGFYEFTHHPDTNQKIEGYVIPGWDELVNFACKLHSTVKSAFVGWDISLTEKGWCVLEGSLEWSVSTFESPHEAPFIETEYPVLHEQWLEIGVENCE